MIGEGPETGVIDRHHRAFGYENLLVCDGSAIPANIGVNPSLTITAMAEHAMSHVARDIEPRRAAVIPSGGMALGKFVLRGHRVGGHRGRRRDRG